MADISNTTLTPEFVAVEASLFSAFSKANFQTNRFSLHTLNEMEPLEEGNLFNHFYHDFTKSLLLEANLPSEFKRVDLELPCAEKLVTQQNFKTMLSALQGAALPALPAPPAPPAPPAAAAAGAGDDAAVVAVPAAATGDDDDDVATRENAIKTFDFTHAALVLRADNLVTSLREFSDSFSEKQILKIDSFESRRKYIGLSAEEIKVQLQRTRIKEPDDDMTLEKRLKSNKHTKTVIIKFYQ